MSDREFIRRALAIKSPRIVFISSSGHSGSTLLDMLISSHPDVVSVGEVVRFSSAPNSRCACGQKAWECPFWLAVDEVIRGRTGLGLTDLQLTRGDPEMFQSHNLALFDAVREVSGKRVIVDSSKRLDRFIPLVDSRNLDVVPIRLTRKPHGVMHSHVKRGRDWRPYADQYAKGLIIAKKYLRERPHIKVRYHQLVATPHSQLARVMHGVGLEYDPEQLNWAGRLRHNMNGNRKVLYSSDSTIRLDTSWRKGLTRRQKIGISLVTLGARMPGRFFYDRLQPLARRALTWQW
jgi:hypothetical protein